MTWFLPPTYAAAYPEAGDAPVPCDQCSRLAAPDMLHDWTRLPAAIRVQLRQPAGRWGCDACRCTLFRDGLIDQVAYAAALGASVEEQAYVIDTLLGDSSALGLPPADTFSLPAVPIADAVDVVEPLRPSEMPTIEVP